MKNIKKLVALGLAAALSLSLAACGGKTTPAAPAESKTPEATPAPTTETKKLNLDAIHDTVHEMCKDEARHCKGFEGLLKRHFGK